MPALDEMDRRLSDYRDLVERRKACDRCTGLVNASRIKGGRYNPDSFRDAGTPEGGRSYGLIMPARRRSRIEVSPNR